jgi:quinol monooxygenase YgiN
MAIIGDKQDCITAIVTFNCEADQQKDLADKVRAYIKDFISEQEGLISSHLHLSICGTRVVNYAQWKSMEHFKAFGEKARSRPELPAMLAFKPHAVFYKVDMSVEGKTK